MSWWLAGSAAASALYGAYSDSKGNRQDARNGYTLAALLGTAAGGSALAGASGGGSGAAAGGSSSSGLSSLGGSGTTGGLALNLGGNSVLSGSSGGSNGAGGIIPGLSSFFGGQQQAAGYEQAAQVADPFGGYRSKYAGLLDSYLSGTTPIQADPGYQFQYNEGQRAVERAMAARGYGNSGNVLAALQQRGQDIASTQYNTIINRLGTLSGATSPQAISDSAAATAGIGKSNAGSTTGLSSALGGLGGVIGGSFGSSSGRFIGETVGSVLGGLV